MSVNFVGGRQGAAAVGVAHLRSGAVSHQPAPVATEESPDPRSELARRQYLDDDLRKAVEDLNHATHFINKQLRFELHDKTNRMIVRVVDTHTQEVIKEIPPEKVLEAVAKMREFIGMLVDERV